ncbi:MAG: c-type cytochrome [Thiobacillus sp.]|nr:c-type cytochrome [Thiobacillus sp.]
MIRISQLGLGIALGLLSLNIQAAGNPELGKAKAMYCATCHGAAGERKLPLWQGGESALADLSANKIVSALKAYRSGQRFHPMMQFFVMPMTEQDMADIAAYYGSVGIGPSLYERLGGKDAINAVVRDLLGNGMADARLKPRLSRLDGARCERQLTDLLCQATGGPCKYTGRDMKTAHAGAHVTEVEWQAFAENLVKTFDRFNVPERERADLMQLIGPMKADIVGH